MNNRWVFSLSSLPLLLCHSPHLRARAHLFGRDKAGRGCCFIYLFFSCADYWMLFEAFPKGWSYSEKGFLFLWCSSIIHRPFFYGLVSGLEGLPKPGCIWISLRLFPSRTASAEQCALKTDKHTNTYGDRLGIKTTTQSVCASTWMCRKQEK